MTASPQDAMTGPASLADIADAERIARILNPCPAVFVWAAVKPVAIHCDLENGHEGHHHIPASAAKCADEHFAVNGAAFTIEMIERSVDPDFEPMLELGPGENQ